MNIGKMLISEQMLLDWIKFPGGKIEGIEYNRWMNEITATIIHPEMPEVEECQPIPTVCPQYTILDNGQLKRSPLVGLKEGI